MRELHRYFVTLPCQVETMDRLVCEGTPDAIRIEVWAETPAHAVEELAKSLNTLNASESEGDIPRKPGPYSY